MVYRQSKLGAELRNEIKSVLTWEQYLLCTSSVRRSPFVKVNKILSLKRGFQLSLIRAVQSVTWKTLYIEDDKAYLYQLPPETRALFGWLIRNDLLATWNFGRSLPAVTTVKTLYLFPAATHTPEGGSYTPSGANGIGAGESYADAALSALGEFVERNASAAYWWENKSLYKSIYKKNSCQVEPQSLSIHNAVMADEQSIAEKSIYWVTAKDLVSNKTVHVPASVVYMNFLRDYPDQPRLHEVTSNGVATYSNYAEAATRAFLELIERHVFVQLWYHKKKCQRINLASLIEVFPELQELNSCLPETDNLNVYEITDFLQVPTFIAVLTSTDPEKTAVHITAAADLDVNMALHKCAKEIVRFAEEQYPVKKEESTPFDATDPQSLAEYASSLGQRRIMWSYQEMIQHIQWLEQATEISYSDIQSDSHVFEDSEERYQWVRRKCQAENVTVYYVDVTNSVAKYAGLHVVRALSPDILPMFFDENLQPETYQSFTHDTMGKKLSLNPIPHPFI
jgi:ribosomal protein S12 methylthiotransferase accessory factor